MDEMNKTPEVIPGKSQATASLVLGIIAVVLWWFGFSAIASVILGIVGLVMASKSKKAGFTGGTRTAGFVLSLIGLIGGVVFTACAACVLVGLGSAAASGELQDALNEAMQSVQ